MEILVHIASNAVLGAILIKLGIIESFGIFLLFISFAFLIDIDHIIFNIITLKTFRISKMIPVMKEYHKRMEPHLYIFHSPEFLLITAVLALSHYIWGLILASNLLHLSLDTLAHYMHNKDFNEFRAWSVSLALWRHLRKRKSI